MVAGPTVQGGRLSSRASALPETSAGNARRSRSFGPDGPDRRRCEQVKAGWSVSRSSIAPHTPGAYAFSVNAVK
jgi:hypothetical protein